MEREEFEPYLDEAEYEHTPVAGKDIDYSEGAQKAVERFTFGAVVVSIIVWGVAIYIVLKIY